MARAPQITLVLQDQSGNLDFDNLVSVSVLKESSLVTFFDFVKQKTGISNQTLDCLTFRHCFAGSNLKVIHADDDEKVWEGFKGNLRRAFAYARSKLPTKREFDIWVERGDTSGDNVEEDNGGL
jgi:hypothetical protein